jgi:hypothetical protein
MFTAILPFDVAVENASRNKSVKSEGNGVMKISHRTNIN